MRITCNSFSRLFTFTVDKYLCEEHQYSTKCPRCPPLKTAFNVEYNIEPGNSRYDRLPFHTSLMVADLRKEIHRRSGCEDFTIAAREGLDGIEYALHEDDTLKEAVKPGESESYPFVSLEVNVLTRR